MHKVSTSSASDWAMGWTCMEFSHRQIGWLEMVSGKMCVEMEVYHNYQASEYKAKSCHGISDVHRLIHRPTIGLAYLLK